MNSELNVNTRRTESIVLQAASGGCLTGASFAGAILDPSMFKFIWAIGIIIGIAEIGVAWEKSRKQAPR